MIGVTSGELLVWHLLLVFVAWALGEAVQRLARGPGGGSPDALRASYLAEPRPWWSPPAWLFGIVWPLLYVLLAVGGWRVRLHEAWGASAALAFYAVLLSLLAVWPLIYSALGLKRLGIAVQAAALAFAVLLCVFAWRVETLAGALQIPLVAWLAFALALAVAIERMRCAPVLPTVCAPMTTPAPIAGEAVRPSVEQWKREQEQRTQEQAAHMEWLRKQAGIGGGGGQFSQAPRGGGLRVNGLKL